MTQALPKGTEGATIVIERVLAAPRELVWSAMTEPRRLMAWWGGPGITNPVCDIDLRPGGRWHQVMRGPGGFELIIDFVFAEVEPPTRLSWRDDPPTQLTTVTLVPAGGGTRWRMVTRFGTAAARDAALAKGFEQVMNTSLDSLAAHLARP